jgi:hypothetical protein
MPWAQSLISYHPWPREFASRATAASLCKSVFTISSHIPDTPYLSMGQVMRVGSRC